MLGIKVIVAPRMTIGLLGLDSDTPPPFEKRVPTHDSVDTYYHLNQISQFTGLVWNPRSPKLCSQTSLETFGCL